MPRSLVVWRFDGLANRWLGGLVVWWLSGLVAWWLGGWFDVFVLLWFGRLMAWRFLVLSVWWVGGLVVRSLTRSTPGGVGGCYCLIGDYVITD